ncbi:MAG: hypothetical protein BGO06_12600 [Shinella sp. 65-6]|nr:MAG: hypothetical protein BGO06_12600 [Shinella sp. 65-6]
MPLLVPQILLALAIALTVGAGLWLMINARSVARLFRRTGVIEPGPAFGRHAHPRSRRAVLAAIVAFNIGWIASVAIWSWAMTGAASEVVDARAG